MILQEINKAYDRIIGSLDCKELKNAFDSIQSLISGSREMQFQDKLNELQETYKYMLRYRIEGAKDPMQEQIYNKIQTSSYELADRIKHKALETESPLSYYSRRRSLRAQPNVTFEKLHLQLSKHHATGNRREYDATQIHLFNMVWVSDPFTGDETQVLKNILFDTELPFTTGCQIVSALMLGLQAAFDLEKLMLLFDAANHENDEIKVRALISILLTLYTYRKRTALYPQITNRLDALSEISGFTKAIQTITLRFILARETEKISRKLQNEIIPEVMKLSPKISNKINLKDITPEQLGEEMNPEWENVFADSSLGKKMQEFSELQLEGADIMHSTFIHLKSFPFFHELSNWLLPFTTEHSSFEDRSNWSNGEKKMLDSMTGAPFMCNSDKYSLHFSMTQLHPEAKKMMINQFESQTADLMQQNKGELVSIRGKLETIAGQYIQDLYRFFKIYPGHLDFNDIFTMPLDFHNLNILRPYISDEESLSTIAEYYLRKNYFNDALVIFSQLAKTKQDSDIIFQKIGYCKQMNDDLQGALEAYLRADLLNPGSKWVLRRIAGCYRSLKEPEEALKYYRRYEKLNPDNLSITISIGHCYLELKNYSEALKCFFKVDYMDSNSKAWRPIAWCSFLTGKYDQARNYYKRILADQPNTQDFLNAGHTEWALQNIKGAIEFYRQAVGKENGDFYKFREEFNQDIPDLIVAGIEDSEISLMMDQLRYVLDSSL